MIGLFAFLMLFSPPISFAEALQSLEVRSILPTNLSSYELERISSELLERATFSARVTNAEYLQTIDDVLDEFIEGKIDLATARLQLKEKLDELGYRPDPFEAGGIKDFSSDLRTNLVLNTNADMAQGYGWFKQGQDSAVLDQWPAQELYRVAQAMQPRDWVTRWQNAGGQVFGGRMVALKDDEVWARISRFGTPYPPFDYGSHMDVRDVDRDTAIDLGLIDRDEQIEPQDRGFNDDLKVSADVRSAALRNVLEDEGYAFDGGFLSFAKAA